MSWNFGMDFGNLLSGGIGVIASNASARKQFKYQSRLQQQAYDLTQQAYREGPSNQRKGLESAGYNPMLAVQNGVAGSNASFPAGQAQSVDYGSKFANAIEVQNMKNQTEQTESINDKNYAEADEAKARKQSLVAKLPFISQREKSEIANIDKDSLLKESQIHNIDETTKYIQKNYELQRMLGLAGIDVAKRGQDVSYNASKYASDVKAETERGIRTDRLPFGFGSTYYDLRGKDKRLRSNDINNRKYWKEYYY